MMEYRGYRAAVQFDDDAGVFHGEVIDTLDVITFQGETVVELRQAFTDSVDEYLTVCTERGRTPDKPFSGRIPLRVSPAVHRAATAAARTEGKSLNAWLAETVERAVQQTT
ncbi:MAG: type II toxin-antitoxin system HicB family antitoxin [Spirochaetaceae bacterium]|nr:type II toxin-antitoxin system HicB family antitoxin [Spirochaetaceae bacterium]